MTVVLRTMSQAPLKGKAASRWHPRHLSRVGASLDVASIPCIGEADINAIDDGRYYWDQCPILDAHGVPSSRDGWELWIALSAPVSAVPTSRHETARLRLLSRDDQDQWLDHGNLLPDEFCPGSREWAGCGVLNDNDDLTLHYTAAGTRGETKASFRQRLFAAAAKLVRENDSVRTDRWRDLGETVSADGQIYERADQLEGEPGLIKAFRDPFFFVDPADGQKHLIFSACSAQAATDKNALIGIATEALSNSGWELCFPLVNADGVTNEMERPHIICHAGLYYLFWSTHGWTMATTIKAPTGLYGMVSRSLLGPYEPLNGSGLVAANPLSQPYQAYSWWVAQDLSVSSFVDMLDGEVISEPDHPHYPVGSFRGKLAPRFQLRLDGTVTEIGEPDK